MYFASIQKTISKIAILLVFFASIAPSISHAIAAQHGVSFLQEVCTINGTKKIVIQTITTHGKKLKTVLNAKTNEKSINATLHLEHCPFCSINMADTAVPPNTAWILMLAEQAKSIRFDAYQPLPYRYIQTAHPTRAPPALNQNT